MTEPALARLLLSGAILALIEEGQAMGSERLQSALVQRLELCEMLAGFLQQSDALITLPAPAEAPATLMTTGDPSFCTLWTLCGVPALTLPSGRGPRGLPLGTQLVGHSLGDARLLQTSAWCERVLRRDEDAGFSAARRE
jgi:Asp-tRNA(Asn)/Glu-tRNA(Gln) amidotransferase A subunit family amidase